MPKLIYLPLEAYSDRYTSQLAAADTGWNEDNWRTAGVNYRRVTGLEHPPRPVGGDGPVIDTGRRAAHCFIQVNQLLLELDAGLIDKDDVIFLDDIWTPGIEQFFLACDLRGVRPKVYGQWWAQSCDRYDFTYPSRDWIRHFERGILERMAGVFVACPSLKYQVDTSYGQLGKQQTDKKVHIVGLPFRSADVIQNLGGDDYSAERQLSDLKAGSKTVVWSSRLDKEKNPYVLADLIQYTVTRLDKSIRFVVCTGQPELRGDQGQIDLLRDVRRKFPDNVHFATGLTKESYYAYLHRARVQFNAANQDWVSFTLLEAAAAGCYPMYPDYRSFPETFLHWPQYLYRKGDYEGAAKKIVEVVNDDTLFTADAIRQRAWIHERFDSTWKRQLAVMGLYPRDLTFDPFHVAHVRAQWPEADLQMGISE